MCSTQRGRRILQITSSLSLSTALGNANKNPIINYVMGNQNCQKNYGHRCIIVPRTKPAVAQLYRILITNTRKAYMLRKCEKSTIHKEQRKKLFVFIL